MFFCPTHPFYPFETTNECKIIWYCLTGPSALTNSFPIFCMLFSLDNFYWPIFNVQTLPLCITKKFRDMLFHMLLDPGAPILSPCPCFPLSVSYLYSSDKMWASLSADSHLMGERRPPKRHFGLGSSSEGIWLGKYLSARAIDSHCLCLCHPSLDQSLC